MTRHAHTASTLVLAGLCSFASASDAHIVQRQAFFMPLSPNSRTVHFAPFDDAGGLRRLVEVEMLYESTIGASMCIENNATIPQWGIHARVTGFSTASIDTPSGCMFGVTLADCIEGPVFLAPTDNDGEPNGAGADFHDFGPVAESTSCAEWSTDAADLAYFTNAAFVPVLVEASASYDLSFTADCLRTISGFGVSGTVTLIYHWEPVRCPGDADGDGLVNIADLQLVLGNFQRIGSPGLPGDVNLDGIVNFADLEQVLGNFNLECPVDIDPLD